MVAGSACPHRQSGKRKRDHFQKQAGATPAIGQVVVMLILLPSILRSGLSRTPQEAPQRCRTM